MILDSNLYLQSHVKEAIARRDIVIIRYISRYVSRGVVDLIYKLQSRPHLDYGYIIYHKFYPHWKALDLHTWSWKNAEGGIEDCVIPSPLSNPNSATAYIMSFANGDNCSVSWEAPLVLNNQSARFANTYFHSALCEWNLPDDAKWNSKSLLQFENKLLSWTTKKFYIQHLRHSGVKLLTKLRVRFRGLNEHRFKYVFDCLSPVFVCDKDNENNKHFLLHCPLYDVLHRDLFDKLSGAPEIFFAINVCFDNHR